MTIFSLLVLSEALVPLLTRGHGSTGPALASSGELVEVALRRLVYVFVAILLLVQPRTIVRPAMRNPLVAGVLAIAVLSALWSSQSLGLQLRLTFGFFIATLFGFYLAGRYRDYELLHLFAFVFGAIAILSFIMVLVFPEYGVTQKAWQSGAWQGVFRHKNVLGHTMVVGSLIFACLAWHGGRGRFTAMLFLMLCVTLIIASRSATALVAAPMLLILVPMWVVINRSRKRLVLMAVSAYLLAGVGIFLVGQREAVLALVGRDLTLTGRTDLWAAVWDLIRANPVRGYGFNAFAFAYGGGLSEQVGLVIGWAAPHSHNGVLGLWLDLGLFGLVLFLGAYLVAVVRTTRCIVGRVSAGTVWPIAYLIAFGLTNVTETAIYSSYLTWAMFVAVATLPSWDGSTLHAPVVVAGGADGLRRTRSRAARPRAG